MSREELGAFQSSIGLPVSANQLPEVMSTLFGSADNVDFPAFLAGYTKMLGDARTAPTSLAIQDKDGNGEVSLAELDKTLDIFLSDEGKKLVFNEADKDGSGGLNVAELDAFYHGGVSTSTAAAAVNRALAPSLPLFALLTLVVMHFFYYGL
jgi:Ca2+-binding EF-hand superfamily protein